MATDYRPVLAWAAGQYGADAGLLTEMARRESGLRPDAVNNWDSNAKKGTPSKGILQFIQPTYEWFAPMAMKANPKAWQGVNNVWTDPVAQSLTAAWAVKNGKGSHWTTYQPSLRARGTVRNVPTSNPLLAAQRPASAGGAPAPVGAAARGGQAVMVPPKPIPPRRVVLSEEQDRAMRVGKFVTGQDYRAEFDQKQAAAQEAYRQQRARYDAAVQANRLAQRAYPAAPSGNGGRHYVGDGHDHSHDLTGATGGFKFRNYKDIMNWAKATSGATIQGDFQTTGGKHSPNSLHYAGKAVDYGDANTNREQFQKLAAFARRYPGFFREFIYNPLGWGIKNGKIVKGFRVGGHDDHMHIGVF